MFMALDEMGDLGECSDATEQQNLGTKESVRRHSLPALMKLGHETDWQRKYRMYENFMC